MGRRADHAAAGGAPRGRAGDGPCQRRRRFGDGRVEQRRHDRSPTSGRLGCGGGSRPTCRPTAPWPSRCSSARSRPEPRPWCSPWTRPVVGTKYADGEQVSGTSSTPRVSRVNFDPGYDDRPGAEKATDLGPHDLGWLAERVRAAGGGQGRAPRRRRPPVRPGRRPGGLGLQPRRPPARPGREHGVRLGAVVAAVADEARGLRRRGSPFGPRRAGRPGARCRRGASSVGSPSGRWWRARPEWPGCTRNSVTR